MTICLSSYRRVVIKIGSSLIVDPVSGLNLSWLESLAADIARIVAAGSTVLVVSSGAIALGRIVLGMPAGKLKLEESQAAAAAGQIELSRAFFEVLGQNRLKTGQILLTYGDTEERRRYLNARATISTLLKIGAVPVINENDTVATNEIRYGDNDRLAARVATMMEADLLVLLSDVDGLYTRAPNGEKAATFVDHVEAITPKIEAMAGTATNQLSRGGMITKIEAAKIATAAGASMIIASGKKHHPLRAIEQSGRCTYFVSRENPVRARKKWIAGHLQSAGTLVIDAGAAKALCAGKSLLPAGVVGVKGSFQRGDVVLVYAEDDVELARGFVAYDAPDAKKIAGLKTAEIEKVLGFAGRSAMIHRDDLAVTGFSGARDGGDARQNL